MGCTQIVQTYAYAQQPDRLATASERLSQQLFITAQIPAGSGLLQSRLREIVKLHFDERLAGPVLPSILAIRPLRVSSRSGSFSVQAARSGRSVS